MEGTAERDAAGSQAPREQDKSYLEEFLGTFSLQTRMEVQQRGEEEINALPSQSICNALVYPVQGGRP